MQSVLLFLSGKKTYIVAFVVAATAAKRWLSGAGLCLYVGGGAWVGRVARRRYKELSVAWLSILNAVLTAAGALVSWLKQRELLEAGRAEIIASNLAAAIDEIGKANDARNYVRGDLLRNPASLRSSGATEARASFCSVAHPILWSGNDTDATIAQVKEHNAVGAALCGWTRSE